MYMYKIHLLCKQHKEILHLEIIYKNIKPEK